MLFAIGLLLSVGLVLSAAGLGSDPSDPEPRAGGARSFADLETKTVDKATEAQIERFAEIRIPASATGLRSATHSFMDIQLLVSFRLPADHLAAFVRSGDFRGKLTGGDRTIFADGSEIGWRLDDAKRLKGLGEIGPDGLGRNLVVVLDDPQRPMVYLEATTS